MIEWMLSHVDLSLYGLNESTVDPLSPTVLYLLLSPRWHPYSYMSNRISITKKQRMRQVIS
jgi:hypothetical protein